MPPSAIAGSVHAAEVEAPPTPQFRLQGVRNGTQSKQPCSRMGTFAGDSTGNSAGVLACTSAVIAFSPPDRNEWSAPERADYMEADLDRQHASRVGVY